MTQRRYGPAPLPMYPPTTPAQQLPAKLTSVQAAAWLGIQRRRMAELMQTLHYTPDPLDGRVKLIDRDEIVKLRESSSRSQIVALAS